MKNGLTIIEVVASGIVLLCVVLMSLNDLFFLVLLMYFWWLFIPCVAILLYSFIDTLFIRKKSRKVLLSIHVLIVLGLFFGISSGTCDADKMAVHYDKYEPKFKELIDYTRSALNDSCNIKLEFEYGKITMFHVRLKDGKWEYHWNEEARERMPLLMQKVGLDEAELKSIKKGLKGIDCVSIETGNGSVEIGYQRVGMGLYSYRVFTGNQTKNEIMEQDDCTTIYYRDNVMFVYGAGAIGNLSFYGKKEFLEKMAHNIPYKE